MSKQEKNNVCDLCPTTVSCSTLKQALILLEAEARKSSDPYLKELCQNFITKVRTYGYDYGESDQLGWLAGKEPYVQALTNEAITIINELRKQKSETLPR